MRLREFSAQVAASERPRLFVWSPVLMMAGVAAFFATPTDPPAWFAPFGVSLALMACVAGWKSNARPWALALLLVTLGFGASQLRVWAVATPLLPQEVHYRQVSGTIDEISPVEGKQKLVVTDAEVEGLDAATLPKRMRVTFRGQDALLKVGDRVTFRASLFPLPSQVMPGAYDFARHFYFQSIGASGFAMRGAEIVAPSQRGGLRVWLDNLRHAIGEDMRAGIEGRAGPVAAAMTVGESGPIAKEVQVALRDSGLSHMLSISGLHLSIVTGILFYHVRLLLTLYPRLALRLAVKKIACAVALLGALLYLMLAGLSIPAQRSFITVSFLFLAVIFDRSGNSLRTLAMSAVILLALFPESMLGPSFQMSFAATLAIVSLYERFGHRLGGASHWSGRLGLHLAGVLLTSLVATFATAPFVLYHFNRFALFGLLANMVVVPLATLVIMPGMVLSLLLLPFGLQPLGYAVLGFGTELMLAMADRVAQLPGAAIALPSLTVGGIVSCTSGLLVLCLVKHRVRLAGLVPFALGLATMSQHEPVDIFIAPKAQQVLARLDSGDYTALRGTARSFTVQNWLRSESRDDLVPASKTTAQCDRAVCDFSRAGVRIGVLKKQHDEEALFQLCTTPHDVVVAWRILNATNCPRAGIRIGRDELEKGGAHTLRFTPQGIQVRTTASERGMRIWHPQAEEQADDEAL